MKKYRLNEYHLVYAGTFDPRKGVFKAVEIAKYLPSNFTLHILGTGSKTEIESILSYIDDTNSSSSCTVVYDGLKEGDEFAEFMERFDLGLSTQDPDQIFNDSSFPSKILTYLSLGLEVLSVNIKAVRDSKVSDSIHFYNSFDSNENIANNIVNILTSSKFSTRENPLHKLDKDFEKDIIELLYRS